MPDDIRLGFFPVKNLQGDPAVLFILGSQFYYIQFILVSDLVLSIWP